MRREVGIAMAVLAAFGAAAGPAAAYYGNGANLISADFGRLEQGDDTTLAVDLAAQSSWAVFQTRARNFFADNDPDPPGQYRQGGVFRRNIDARDSPELVAGGDVRSDQSNALITRGAQNPSVSGNGRYVVFSTGQALVPTDTNNHVDVYVRDMNVPASDPVRAFDLVSAQDGGQVPAAYAPRSQPAPGIDPGAEVSRGAAISDDGRYVVFRTVAASNLPAGGATSTPTGQLFVRDRETKQTRLITRQMGSQTPAGGALGASISGDGTTVAWTGRSAVAQTPFLRGESLSDSPYYLWQRWSDGTTAPTRRVTGTVDLDDPSCDRNSTVQDSPTVTGACYGPLTLPEHLLSASIANQVPVLDGSGYQVSFLTGAGPRPNAQTPDGLDLWTTSMAPGVTRKAGSIELTREAGGPDASLEGLAASTDGRYLAFTTYRTIFRLPVLSPIGDFRSQADQRELYLVDLQQRTLERVVRSISGGDTGSGVDATPTMTADGSRIAFTSVSADLFYGDANQRGDAFVVSRQPEPAAEAPSPPVSSGVPDRETVTGAPRPRPSLSVRAKALNGGVIEIRTAIPAAGTVKVTATTRLGRGRRARTVVLATASKRNTKRGTVVIRVRPVRRYQRELRKRRKLSARFTVGYVASTSNQRLSRSLNATFIQKIPRRSKKR